jgi:hypothetical protein
MSKRICLLFLLIYTILITGGCDLFQVSLVDYLKNEDFIEETNGPWVYVAAGSGNDAFSGLTRSNAVKTLGKALDIWAAGGSGSARIMVLEDIVYPAYNEPVTLIRNGVIDFSALLASRPGITSITLSGPRGRKAVCRGETGVRAVLFINTPGAAITLRNLVITGGGGWSGGGIYVGGGSLAPWCGYFNVDGKGFGNFVDSDGKLR